MTNKKQNLLTLTGASELTPVELISGIHYKRDDLFVPFKGVDFNGSNLNLVNGGKVRQAIFLFDNEYENIKNNCDNKVACGGGVSSPQLGIISAVALYLGIKPIGVIGGVAPLTEDNKEEYEANMARSLKKHNLVDHARIAGAEIRGACKLGYNSAITAKIKDWQKDEKMFEVRFGINLEDNEDAIIGSTEDQVRNLPDGINNLVLPVGSGIIGAGILRGLIKHKKKEDRPKNIILIQIANTSRKKTVDKLITDKTKLFAPKLKYTMILDDTYPYATSVTQYIDKENNIDLDSIYEAKAYEYAIKNELLLPNRNDCFWIVGNANPLRKA